MPEVDQYWRGRLAGFAEPTVLGVERPAFAGPRAVHEVCLTDRERTALHSAADRLGTAPGRLALAAWCVLLIRYGAPDDLLFGTTVTAGPDRADTEDPSPGTAPLAPMRLTVTFDRSVRDLLDAVTQALPDPRRVRCEPHELHALTDLAQDVPLYDKDFRLAGDRGQDAVPERENDREQAKEPLPVDLAVTTGPVWRIRLDHDTARLDEPAGAQLLRHFRHLLASLAEAREDTPVGELGLLDEEELHRILHEWNDTATVRDDAACIHELVERQAARTPDATAVVQGDTKLTYVELDRQADAVAANLAARGIGPGDFVALHMDRTVHSVVALLGVLKAGAAYAPVECSLPPERVRRLLASLHAPAVLCSPSRLASIAGLGTELPDLRHLLWLGDVTAEQAEQLTATTAATNGAIRADAATAPVPAGAPEPRRATPDDLAYVIFTSGSTGTPKGVLLKHAPVVNLIRWVNSTFDMGAADRVLFITAFGFDLSVYDVFGLLAAGGSIRIASEREVADPQRLLTVLDEEPITFWDSAPAALQQLEPLFALRTPPADSTLRLVFLSGDWIPVALPDAVRTAFPRAEVVALGGATEAAIWSNFHRVGTVDPSWNSIPYGRPVHNARYYILDRDLRPAPVGVPGDLYIGGHCLASGYHNDPELTGRKFVPDPFVPDPEARMYHTGDRARFWPDGKMEFLGRVDSQVKLRGFRIELGEVEAVLSALDGVGSAVAHVHGAAETAQLMAYAVPTAHSRPDPATLREQLARTLPAYMVPSEVVILPALPATPNGKLDRRALPSPGEATAHDPRGGSEPSTPLEAALAGIWTEVLGKPVDADSNFFAVGGQSLLVVRVIAYIKASLKADVPLRLLMDHPRLRDFAREAEPFLPHQSD